MRVHERQAATYVHVDDTVFISSKDDGPLHCDKLLDLTVSGLGAVGFQLTQQSKAGDLEKDLAMRLLDIQQSSVCQ